MFSFFCLNFLLKLITSILLADQRSAIRDIILLSSKLLNLIFLFIVYKTTNPSLFTFGLVYCLSFIFAIFIANIYFFLVDYKEYLPSLNMANLWN